MPPRERWRDVAAAYLVHLGLRLAGPRTRHDIATHLAAELRADVAERLRETVATRLAPARARGRVTNAAMRGTHDPCRCSQPAVTMPVPTRTPACSPFRIGSVPPWPPQFRPGNIG